MNCPKSDDYDCLDQFRRIDARLGEIATGIAEIKTLHGECSKRIDRTEKTLFGNGSTGLTTKVNAIIWLSSAIAGFVVLLAGSAISAWIGR